MCIFLIDSIVELSIFEYIGIELFYNLVQVEFVELVIQVLQRLKNFNFYNIFV